MPELVWPTFRPVRARFMNTMPRRGGQAVPAGADAGPCASARRRPPHEYGADGCHLDRCGVVAWAAPLAGARPARGGSRGRSPPATRGPRASAPAGPWRHRPRPCGRASARPGRRRRAAGARLGPHSAEPGAGGGRRHTGARGGPRRPRGKPARDGDQPPPAAPSGSGSPGPAPRARRSQGPGPGGPLGSPARRVFAGARRDPGRGLPRERSGRRSPGVAAWAR